MAQQLQSDKEIELIGREDSDAAAIAAFAEQFFNVNVIFGHPASKSLFALFTGHKSKVKQDEDAGIVEKAFKEEYESKRTEASPVAIEFRYVPTLKNPNQCSYCNKHVRPQDVFPCPSCRRVVFCNHSCFLKSLMQHQLLCHHSLNHWVCFFGQRLYCGLSFFNTRAIFKQLARMPSFDAKEWKVVVGYLGFGCRAKNVVSKELLDGLVQESPEKVQKKHGSKTFDTLRLLHAWLYHCHGHFIVDIWFPHYVTDCRYQLAQTRGKTPALELRDFSQQHLFRDPVLCFMPLSAWRSWGLFHEPLPEKYHEPVFRKLSTLYDDMYGNFCMTT